MTPTVDRPEITVETIYRSAAPQEVENEIVERQEEKLTSIQNLREMVSTSYEGHGTITLRFDWAINKDVARYVVSPIPTTATRPRTERIVVLGATLVLLGRHVIRSTIFVQLGLCLVGLSGCVRHGGLTPTKRDGIA